MYYGCVLQRDVDNTVCIGVSVLRMMAGRGKGVSTFAKYVQKLHDGTERICVAKIDSFT